MRSGLVGDERHPEHFLRDLLGLFRGLHDLDAAALAAAAGVDLRLDHDGRSETARDGGRVGGREHDFPSRHGHAVFRKDGLGLVLVDFHRGRNLSIMCRGSEVDQAAGLRVSKAAN